MSSNQIKQDPNHSIKTGIEKRRSKYTRQYYNKAKYSIKEKIAARVNKRFSDALDSKEKKEGEK